MNKVYPSAAKALEGIVRDGQLLADGPPQAVLSGALLGELFGMSAELRGSGAAAWVEFAP